jgi:hypothetical protein
VRVFDVVGLPHLIAQHRVRSGQVHQRPCGAAARLQPRRLLRPPTNATTIRPRGHGGSIQATIP